MEIELIFSSEELIFYKPMEHFKYIDKTEDNITNSTCIGHHTDGTNLDILPSKTEMKPSLFSTFFPFCLLSSNCSFKSPCCLFLIHVFIYLPHEYAHISIILFRVFLNFRWRYHITQILLHLFIQPHSCKIDLISHFIAYTNIFYIHVSCWWTFKLFPLSVRK